MRLPFLILTPVSIFLSYSAVYNNHLSFRVVDLLLITLGALAAHISVNSFNEYYDFKSGLDSLTEKTPFSGGSGALIENPHSSVYVLFSAIISLTITILVGLYFILECGFIILPFGLFGIIIIVSYTQWLNRSPFLCLIAPGLAFGPLMVVGSFVAFTQQFSWNVFLISLVPFFLVNNLLLLNQLPDIEADTTVGRKHFPIVYGIKNSLNLYLLINLATLVTIVLLVTFKIIPTASLLATLPILLSFKVYQGLNSYRDEIKRKKFSKIEPLLGLNAALTVCAPIILGVTLILAERNIL